MRNITKLICLSIFIISPYCIVHGETFTEAFKNNIKSRVNNGINTGIVVGVITPEGTEFYSYGVKSLKTNEPVNELSVFEVGSISKTFTGILLADEVIKHNLSLNTPLQTLLPDGVNAPRRNGESIRLVHLANHTSSLPAVPGNLKRTNPANPYADYTEEQLYEYLNNCELPRDIGSKAEYSNLGMGLLGHVLATKNQTTYEDLAVDRISNPLGMTDTRITLTESMKKRLAKGHRYGVETCYYDFQALAGAGAIRSTAFDMLKYLAANMGFVKSDLYPAMVLSHKDSGSKLGNMTVGLGWMTETVEGEDIIWHDGGTGGCMSFIGFTEDRKKGVVVLTNSIGFPDDIGFHLLNPKSELKNPKPSIAIKLYQAIEKNGIEAAVKVYWQLKKDPSSMYDASSNEMIRFGYRLLQRKRLKEAMEIFRINVESYPDDWNANDSYAEALLKNNEKEKAIKYYKISIGLNPENSAAINLLKGFGIEMENPEKKNHKQ